MNRLHRYLSLCLGVGFLSAALASLSTAEEGIPLGGIGTGKIELYPNGNFGAFTIHQQPHAPIPNAGNSFASVYVKAGGSPITKKLQERDPNGIETVSIRDVYPYEKVVYQDPGLPVTVTLQAYSPMMIRDAQNSMVPGAVLNYQVENPSDEPIEAAIALSMQNLIGGYMHQNQAVYAEGGVVHEADTSGSEQGVTMRFIPLDEDEKRGDFSILARVESRDTLSFLPLWDNSSADGWMRFEMEGRFNPLSAKQVTQTAAAGRPAAAVAIKRTLPASGSTTFTFAVAWYAPHWKNANGTTHTARYAKAWNASPKTARYLLDEHERIRAEMDTWAMPLTQSGLPAPLMAAVMNGFKPLIRDSVWLEDGGFSLISHDPEWRGNIGTPEERLAMLPFFLHAFPQLLYSELDVLMGLQLASGEVPSFVGKAGERFGTLDVDGAFLKRPDSTIAFVLLLYEYYLWNGGTDVLDTVYPHIRSAIGWLQSQDESGDGVPDGESLIAGTKQGTLSLWTADSFLAALRAGEEIGIQKMDIELQNRCAKSLRGSAEHIIAQLWNGRRFHAGFHPAQPGDVLGESVFPGTWYARLNGWYPHFGIDLTRLAVQTLAIENSSPWINQSLLLDYGYSPQSLSPRFRTSAQSMSSWTLWNRLAGVSLDMPRKALILSPVFLPQQHSVEYPLCTPPFDGRIQSRYSERTGITESVITFEQRWGDRSAELEEISFLTPGVQDPSRFALYVLHNGTPISGQDFIREGLRVFRFTQPLQCSPEDRLTLTAAPLNGGKVVVDAEQGRIINMGANCTIEPVRIRHDQISFRLVNLQEAGQLVRLETRGTDASDFLVFVNGQSIGSVADGISLIPLFLTASPIPSQEHAWLNNVRNGCIEAIQHTGEHNLTALSRRLWDLQEEVERAYTADSGLRGFQIDLLDPEAVAEASFAIAENDASKVMKQIENARKSLDIFLNDLPKLTRDPVLASEVTGFFVPLRMQPVIAGAGLNAEPFTIAVKVPNPAGLEARARVGIELPEGWRYTTEGAIETELSPQTPAFACQFMIEPNAVLQEKRYSMRLTLSGSWRGHAFRCKEDLAIGHNFVKTWMLAGPLKNNGGQGFEQRHQLELNIKTDETYKSGTRDIVWKEMTFPDGFVDMDAAFQPNDDVVGYAYVAVYSPREQRVRVHLGADEGVKVFHNYQEIYSQYRTASMRPGTERFNMRLYQGWNHILVKVQEHQGAWGFFFEITDLKNQSIPALQYALDQSRS